MIARAESPALAAVLNQGRRRWAGTMLTAAAVIGVIVAALLYAGAFDVGRYVDALPTLGRLAAESWPPDLSRWRSWGRPLAETLAMSLAGTALGALMAAPLGICAARNLTPHPALAPATALLLNFLRALPTLIWGVLFVAAVGFGPLPGALALAFHSTGMLGKFFAETLEHVEPGPGDALRSQGVSALGVLRFSILPQVAPRWADVLLYRWEHNLRAATTLGVVGCGGLGLEVVTAFHLFEYREAAALLCVTLALVTGVNGLSGVVRRRFTSTGR